MRQFSTANNKNSTNTKSRRLGAAASRTFSNNVYSQTTYSQKNSENKYRNQPLFGGAVKAGSENSIEGDNEIIDIEPLKSPRFKDDPVLQMVILGTATLQKDMRGVSINKAVQKIQRGLIDAGFPLTNYGPDGLFGSETRQAVLDFQVSKLIPPDLCDGKVNDRTLHLLDQHFSQDMKQVKPSPQTPSSVIDFTVQDSPARYSNPHGEIQNTGQTWTLYGPRYHNLSKIATSSTSWFETRKWDIGHTQDVIASSIKGTYQKNHEAIFKSPLPIRDAERTEPLYPWYGGKYIRQAQTHKPSICFMGDNPEVSFESVYKGNALTKIQMAMKFVNWITARNRYTGETRFLHHINWGFQYHADIDPTETPGHEPEFATGSNDPISQGTGVGAVHPCMSEPVFNEAARLIRK